MRAKKTKTHVRREQIVGAALDIIAYDGLTALSVAGIGNRVGIAPSALYRHFKGKEEVLDAVLDFIERRLMDNVKQVREETSNASKRLESLLRRHARMLSENRAIPHVVFSDGIYTGHPERKSKVAGIITGYLDEVRRIIEEGQREEVLHQEVDAQTASVMFLGMILPAAVLWNVSEGGFDIARHVEKAWPAFLRSIRKE